MKKDMKARAKAAAPKAKPEPPRTDEVLDLKAATEFLKVSKPTFYRWLAQGRLQGFKAGQQWRFYRRDLQKFLETEEPIVPTAGVDALDEAIRAGRKARKLPPVEWDRPGELLDPELAASDEAVIQRAVSTVIADALDARASDIHIDGNPDSALVRYRIDGVLMEAMTIPRAAQVAMISRLKILGDMNAAERRIPQDGRISVKHHGRDYDVRVHTEPAVFGESAIMRVLDQSHLLIGLDKLGMADPMRKTLERKLKEPSGLIVVTGPAGSGRTTTLYSALSLLNSPQVKIVTLEDPVEVRLRNAMQVHVNRKAGLTFEVGVRSFMRCDPNIVMIGDLKDLGTAEVCMQAAMTGHIVLTNMLPPDAPTVITRLIEMGVEPFLVGAALTTVLSQRLVRMVCQSCKVEYQPSPAGLRRMGMDDAEISHAKFYRGQGCERCRQTGYRGRMGIFELLEVDDRLREMIAGGASTTELREAAVAAGMTTMLRDGLDKARQGLTTVEEVMRLLSTTNAATRG
jgi:excisionase family DNA binding protein